VGRAFDSSSRGDLREPAGICGSLVRDERGMLSCLDSKRTRHARDRSLKVSVPAASSREPRGLFSAIGGFGSGYYNDLGGSSSRPSTRLVPAARPRSGSSSEPSVATGCGSTRTAIPRPPRSRRSSPPTRCLQGRAERSREVGQGVMCLRLLLENDEEESTPAKIQRISPLFVSLRAACSTAACPRSR
jgi:hypothetical protein